ncbi:MAG TPA: cell cycle transcriptional regulator TrcR, partial [Phenylobacterium sp.]|uniref:cell cycle transcriptional regulator TrcR n=1 Tax=Phenylobacterium sp. TaxID=1871053 RepID=UPI002D2C7F78
RPDAIAWFLRNHPEVADAQLARILGTTKATIDQVRNRTHWNSANIKPVDPVTLGLSTQLELDAVVKKAAEKKARDDKRKGIVEPEGPTLMPASETGVVDRDEPENDHDHSHDREHTAQSVFEDEHDEED